MSKGNKYRFDRLAQSNGFLGTWVFSSDETKNLWSEHMLAVYDLKAIEGEEKTKHAEGVTHEVMLFALSPEVKVNYRKNVFAQPELRPLKPAILGYQFAAPSDDAAVEIIQKLVDKARKGTLSLNREERHTWDGEITGAINLYPPKELFRTAAA